MPVIARDTVASDHLVYAWPFPIGPDEYEVACAEDEQVVMCPAWLVGGLFGPGRHRWRSPDPMRPSAAYFVLTAPVESSFDCATLFQVPVTGEIVRVRATGSVHVRCGDPSLLVAQFVGLPFDMVNDGILRSVSRSVERMLARLLTRRVVMAGTTAAVTDPLMLPSIVEELIAYNPAAGAVFGVELVRMGHMAIHADDGTRPWDHVMANPDWGSGRRRPPLAETDRVVPPPMVDTTATPTESIRVPRAHTEPTLQPIQSPFQGGIGMQPIGMQSHARPDSQPPIAPPMPVAVAPEPPPRRISQPPVMPPAMSRDHAEVAGEIGGGPRPRTPTPSIVVDDGSLMPEPVRPIVASTPTAQTNMNMQPPVIVAAAPPPLAMPTPVPVPVPIVAPVPVARPPVVQAAPPPAPVARAPIASPVPPAPVSPLTAMASSMAMGQAVAGTPSVSGRAAVAPAAPVAAASPSGSSPVPAPKPSVPAPAARSMMTPAGTPPIVPSPSREGVGAGANGGAPVTSRSTTLPSLPPPPKPGTPTPKGMPVAVPAGTPLPSVRRPKTVEVVQTEESTQPNGGAPAANAPPAMPAGPSAAVATASPAPVAVSSASTNAATGVIGGGGASTASGSADRAADRAALKSTRIGHAVAAATEANEPRGAIMGIGMAHIGSSQVASGEIPQKVAPGSRVLVPGADGLMQSATVRQLLQGYYELEVGGTGETIWVPVSGVVPES